ncbi:MAG TPA: 16S rRNA (guanine(966)-N(2))-methyltransferase RsmD [Terracidiphilus sp.]|nr:16S rRNA (guanine(966)-N(2))-methyltransferase RsmD [Terracidiphilus sp.]
MRIITGSLRSRRLEAPKGLGTRPTSDRLRETLFNVLAGRIQGAAFLDLYAGSGAVGIEALSRGAARVEFVERDSAALKILRGNLERLGLAGLETAGECRIHTTKVGSTLRKMQAASGNAGVVVSHPNRKNNYAARVGHPVVSGAKFDLVFLDPPWEAAEEYAVTLGLLGGAAAGLLSADAVVIAEHRRKMRLEDRYGLLERTRLLEQGDAALSFYATTT